MSYVTSIGTTTGDLEGDLVCPSAIAELLVRIFYARQFSAFISLLSPANETRYVQSHLSCVCLSVCLSVCPLRALTLERLHLQASFLTRR